MQLTETTKNTNLPPPPKKKKTKAAHRNGPYHTWGGEKKTPNCTRKTEITSRKLCSCRIWSKQKRNRSLSNDDGDHGRKQRKTKTKTTTKKKKKKDEVCSRGHNWEATTTGLLLATTWRYADVALATNFSPLISCSHVTMMIPIRGP